MQMRGRVRVKRVIGRIDTEARRYEKEKGKEKGKIVKQWVKELNKDKMKNWILLICLILEA